MYTTYNLNELSNIPSHWVKTQEALVGTESISREQNDIYVERHYFLARVSRVALGILLSVTLIAWAFQDARNLIHHLLFSSIKAIHVVSKNELVDVHVSMAGNPVHMGHMHMTALAVNRLKKENYQINKVKIFLSEEEYLKNKVYYCNLSTIKNNDKELLRVFIPRDKRIEFLRAAVLQAKDDGILDQNLDIDYSEETKPSKVKVFNVWGADLAEEKCNFQGEQGLYKHAIIVARQNSSTTIAEVHTKQYSRLIVTNSHESSGYSSSKIQNGAYELLPPAVRGKFKKLHEAVQRQPTIIKADPKDPALQTRREETEKMECPIARVTGRATTDGFYISPSGKTIALRTGEQLLKDSCVIPNAILNDPVQPRYADQKIVVVNRDSLVAAQDELKNGAKKVAVLMFASPIEPGGAMKEVQGAQEEDLCKRSDIFGFMWDQYFCTSSNPIYSLVGLERSDQKNPNYNSMSNNKMILVPNVTVFRSGKDDKYSLLDDPFQVGMLVSPALNKPDYTISQNEIFYDRDADEEQLNKVITAQLKSSYDENYDTIILGAFGCGAFRNPPELIAKFYKKIIDERFSGAFKKIVFAILDDAHTGGHNPEGNLKPFQKCFN